MSERTLLNPHPRNEMTAKARGWGGRALTYLILLGWSLFTIFALSWIVLASFKTSREIFREPFKLPAEIQWEN